MGVCPIPTSEGDKKTKMETIIQRYDPVSRRLIDTRFDICPSISPIIISGTGPWYLSWITYHTYTSSVTFISGLSGLIIDNITLTSCVITNPNPVLYYGDSTFIIQVFDIQGRFASQIVTLTSIQLDAPTITNQDGIADLFGGITLTWSTNNIENILVSVTADNSNLTYSPISSTSCSFTNNGYDGTPTFTINMVDIYGNHVENIFNSISLYRPIITSTNATIVKSIMPAIAILTDNNQTITTTQTYTITFDFQVQVGDWSGTDGQGINIGITGMNGNNYYFNIVSVDTFNIFGPDNSGSSSSEINIASSLSWSSGDIFQITNDGNYVTFAISQYGVSPITIPSILSNYSGYITSIGDLSDNWNFPSITFTRT